MKKILCQDQNKNCLGQEQKISSHHIKRSFKETLKLVETRIEWESLPFSKRAKGRELAMIIAEIETLPPDAPIRIEGNDLTAEYVSEIYSLLRNQHIEFVIDSLEETKHRIMTAKTYARTSLYNAAMTMEIAMDNIVKSNM